MTFVNEVHLLGYVSAISDVKYYEKLDRRGQPVQKAVVNFSLWGKDRRPQKGETRWHITCICFDFNAETFHAKVRVGDKVLVFGHLREVPRGRNTLHGTAPGIMVACRFAKLIHPSLRARNKTHVLIPLEDVERVREAEELLYATRENDPRTALEVSQAETGTRKRLLVEPPPEPPADVTIEPIETTDAERPEYTANPDLPDDWGPRKPAQEAAP